MQQTVNIGMIATLISNAAEELATTSNKVLSGLDAVLFEDSSKVIVVRELAVTPGVVLIISSPE